MQTGRIAKRVFWWLIVATSDPLAVVAQSSGPAVFTTPYLVDIRASHASIDDQDALNVALWGPNLNGGFGSWRDGNGGDTTYGGAMFRPFGGDTDNDLVFGLNYLNIDGIRQSEAQGQYIGRSGVGFGLGYVEGIPNDRNLYFTKFIYRNKYEDWKVYLSPQWQRNPDSNDLGGYVALSTDEVFMSAGTDGEQWRGLLGFITKRREAALIHPTGEILYVDNSLGDRDGVKFFFVNGSLRYAGDFMSPASRLGRALGPTGTQFGNSLSFLSPNWNRTADVWEIGQLANMRIIKADFPNGQEVEIFETVVFPTQFVRDSSWANGLFLGLQTRDFEIESRTLQSGTAGMIGYKRRFDQVFIASQLLHNFELSSSELVFTFKYFFFQN